MDMAKAIDHFTLHLKANGCSVHTVRSYACDLRKLERFCRRKRLRVERITTADLARPASRSTPSR